MNNTYIDCCQRHRTINLLICWVQYIIIMVYTGIDPAEHVGNDYVAIWCRYDCSDILRDNMNSFFRQWIQFFHTLWTPGLWKCHCVQIVDSKVLIGNMAYALVRLHIDHSFFDFYHIEFYACWLCLCCYRHSYTHLHCLQDGRPSWK